MSREKYWENIPSFISFYIEDIMLSKIIHFVICITLSIGVSSCRSKRGPKEYIEKNGLHSDKKPHEIASEIGNQGKKQQRSYRKGLAKEWKKRHPGEPRKSNPYR